MSRWDRLPIPRLRGICTICRTGPRALPHLPPSPCRGYRRSYGSSFPYIPCDVLPGRRSSEHSVTTAGRSLGGGRPHWLAPTGYLSRRRERCRCLWLLWLVPLWLRLAGCSDEARWPPEVRGAWASATLAPPRAGIVALALARAGVGLGAPPVAHWGGVVLAARVVLVALVALAFPAPIPLAHAIAAPALILRALVFPDSRPILLALAAWGTTWTSILVRLWGWKQIPPSAHLPKVRGPIRPSQLQE